MKTTFFNRERGVFLKGSPGADHGIDSEPKMRLPFWVMVRVAIVGSIVYAEGNGETPVVNSDACPKANSIKQNQTVSNRIADSANVMLEGIKNARPTAQLQSLEWQSKSQIISREFESIVPAIAVEASEAFGQSHRLDQSQLSLSENEYPSSVGSNIATKHL